MIHPLSVACRHYAVICYVIILVRIFLVLRYKTLLYQKSRKRNIKKYTNHDSETRNADVCAIIKVNDIIYKSMSYYGKVCDNSYLGIVDNVKHINLQCSFNEGERKMMLEQLKYLEDYSSS